MFSIFWIFIVVLLYLLYLYKLRYIYYIFNIQIWLFCYWILISLGQRQFLYDKSFWKNFCYFYYSDIWVSQVALVVKNPPTNAGDTRGVDSIPGWRWSPGGGRGDPLQYSCLKIPFCGLEKDRGAWRAMVCWVAKSTHTHTHTHTQT